MARNRIRIRETSGADGDRYIAEGEVGADSLRPNAIYTVKNLRHPNAAEDQIVAALQEFREAGRAVFLAHGPNEADAVSANLVMVDTNEDGPFVQVKIVG